MPAPEKKAASAAASLLDMAYAALLKSDFAALPEISQRLERELEQAGARLGEDDLRQIRQKADRNAVVLLAAQRGIRSARRRLDEIRNTASGLVTYDRQGKRASVGEGHSLAQRL